MGSTPEGDPSAPQDGPENHDHPDNPDQAGQPKRKGGRKPVCWSRRAVNPVTRASSWLMKRF